MNTFLSVSIIVFFLTPTFAEASLYDAYLKFVSFISFLDFIFVFRATPPQMLSVLP